MNNKISIIIPVYNAENYISYCIESLINQTLQQCEFIFVNDGSEDRSQQIIEDYQKIDNRIKLVNQKNQGVSIARNTGLKMANGEYIGFVDADDYVEKDMYERLYNSVHQDNCDVIISNFKGNIEGHEVITRYPFPTEVILEQDYIEKEILPYFLRSDNLNTVVNKIYKNSLLKEKNVQFPEKIHLGEDGIFNMLFFSNAKNVKYVNYEGYYYREVVGSATRNISERDYFQRALEVYMMGVPGIHTGDISQLRVNQLKSIKFINSVISYIHIYFKPSKDVGFRKRYKYVRNMIRNRYVREALPLYYSEVYSTLGRYEQFILNLIKIESTLGLYCAATYSWWRNK